MDRINEERKRNRVKTDMERSRDWLGLRVQIPRKAEVFILSKILRSSAK
jgi:hypothetical protein